MNRFVSNTGGPVGFLPRFVAAARPLSVAWRYRELIIAVLRREVADRFTGSAFAWLWAVAGPLITLFIYTLTFTRAMRLPMASAQGDTSHYALSTFVGLIVFGAFAEMCSRGPLLLHEHAWFLKTSIFPSETLAWIAVLRALFFAGVSFIVLLVFQLALTHGLRASLIALPFVVLPLILFLLGLAWVFSAIGSFTRDLSHLMTTFVPLMIFATPVFYRISDLPASLQVVAYLNPVGAAIEMARDVILWGTLPPPWAYATFCVISFAVFRGGYAIFDRYKGILLDAI